MTSRRRRVGQRLVVLTAALLAAFLAGGCSPESNDTPVKQLQHFKPGTVFWSAFAAVTDWHTLDSPTEELRQELDGINATYRVVDAETDNATLAIWVTDHLPWPDDDREAIYAGCVQLRRLPNGVSAGIVSCSTPIATRHRDLPRARSVSWGYDSAAIDRAEIVISQVESEVRWLLTKEPDGTSRTTSRTREQVLRMVEAAAQRARMADTEGYELKDVSQEGQIVTGFIVAHAAAIDPVDTRRTVSAQACAHLRVDLDYPTPAPLFTTAPCRTH